jgi:hypothetical protein
MVYYIMQARLELEAKVVIRQCKLLLKFEDTKRPTDLSLEVGIQSDQGALLLLLQSSPRG